MQSIGDIFDLFGGLSEVGRILHKRPEHIGSMKARGSIPVAYWPALIEAAEERGLREITSETLTRLHAAAAAARVARRSAAHDGATPNDFLLPAKAMDGAE